MYLVGFIASKLSANLCDIYHCCVYSAELLMKDRGTVRNMYRVLFQNKFEKLVHLVGFIKRIFHDARSPVRQIHKIRNIYQHLQSQPTQTLLTILLCGV